MRAFGASNAFPHDGFRWRFGVYRRKPVYPRKAIPDHETCSFTRRRAVDDVVPVLHLCLHNRAARGHSIRMPRVVWIAADTTVQIPSTYYQLALGFVSGSCGEHLAECALEVPFGGRGHGLECTCPETQEKRCFIEAS